MGKKSKFIIVLCAFFIVFMLSIISISANTSYEFKSNAKPEELFVLSIAISILIETIGIVVLDSFKMNKFIATIVVAVIVTAITLITHLQVAFADINYGMSYDFLLENCFPIVGFKYMSSMLLFKMPFTFFLLAIICKTKKKLLLNVVLINIAITIIIHIIERLSGTFM